jgi:hypothetical protein
MVSLTTLPLYPRWKEPLVPNRYDPSVVHPAASRYTDYTKQLKQTAKAQ